MRAIALISLSLMVTSCAFLPKFFKELSEESAEAAAFIEMETKQFKQDAEISFKTTATDIKKK